MHEPNVDSVGSTLPTLPTRTQEAWDAAKARTAGTLHQGEAFVRANPIPIVLGVLVVGVVLGVFMTRREPTFQERHIHEPLDNLRGILSDLHARAASEAGRGGDAATQAIHSLTGRIKRGLRFW